MFYDILGSGSPQSFSVGLGSFHKFAFDDVNT